MQKYCITQQGKARTQILDTYNRLVKQEQRMDERLYDRIVGRCTEQHGYDDAVILEYCTRKQIEAYFSLQKVE